MKYTTATVLATSAALVGASPIAQADATPGFNQVFRLMTIRSGSDIQYSSIQAINSGFRINAPSQGAFCGPEARDYASFSLSPEGDLYLYTPNPPQQAVVDRSGMGQGIIQFTTGVQPIGKNQQRGPFKIDDEGNLVFDAGNGDTQGFQACPNALGGGYSVWLAGVTNPGGEKDCVGFTAKALKEENPLKCSYTNH